MMGINIQPKSALVTRSLGPDLVRALAAFMVVYLHCCIPYLTHPMPGLVWPVSDSPGWICDSLYWAIEIFIMPLFLIITGYYAYRSMKVTDGRSFIRSRARRLLSPLLFGIAVILPMDLYIWVLGLVAEGVLPPSKLRSLKIPSPYGDHLWGTSHLWFLLYVFLYVALMPGLASLIRGRVPLRLRPEVRRGLALSMVTLGLLTLMISPEVVYGFQHSFFPVFSKWIYSGTFFVGGVAIAIFDPHFRTIDRLAFRHFSLGVVATIAAVMLGSWTLGLEDQRLRLADSSILVSASLAAMTVLSAWSVALGAIGIANRMAPFVERHQRVSHCIRYVAGASFWIYVMHHPIVGLIHIDLKWLLPWIGPFTKSLFACGIVIALGLVTYEYLIRTTAFGRWIGVVDSNKLKIDDKTKESKSTDREQLIRIAA